MYKSSVRTNNIPFAVGDVVGEIHCISAEIQVDLQSVVSPRAELEEAQLVVERKPGDVYGAGGLVQSRRDPFTTAVRRHLYVCSYLTVDVLVCTARK